MATTCPANSPITTAFVLGALLITGVLPGCLKRPVTETLIPTGERHEKHVRKMNYYRSLIPRSHDETDWINSIVTINISLSTHVSMKRTWEIDKLGEKTNSALRSRLAAWHATG